MLARMSADAVDMFDKYSTSVGVIPDGEPCTGQCQLRTAREISKFVPKSVALFARRFLEWNNPEVWPTAGVS